MHPLLLPRHDPVITREKDSPRLIPIRLVLRAQGSRMPEAVADPAAKLGQRPVDRTDSRMVLLAQRADPFSLHCFRPAHCSPNDGAVLGEVPAGLAEPADNTRSRSPKAVHKINAFMFRGYTVHRNE